ncbi:MAG: prepilin-type N-terminal cleavage/methylation domain-containing protein [Verrucomicrobiales bacterium]|nr:prepilin-type N-terminal cleavage/methylation domain-containing protein [Verrucomicrobiales bacterium]
MFIHPTATSNTAHPASARGGFTLIEVLAALALMMVVMAGVYGISGAAVELGRSMSDARVIETRVTNFVTVWRDYFETLPPDIRFTGGVNKTAHNGAGTLRIEGGKPPFAWHRALQLAPAVELAVENAGSGAMRLVVRHLREPERPLRPGDYEVMAEMPLLEDLDYMNWQYYDAEERKWFNNWDPEKRPKPPLFLRVRFRLLRDARVHEHVFWVANDLAEGINPNAMPAQGGPSANGNTPTNNTAAPVNATNRTATAPLR